MAGHTPASPGCSDGNTHILQTNSRARCFLREGLVRCPEHFDGGLIWERPSTNFSSRLPNGARAIQRSRSRGKARGKNFSFEWGLEQAQETAFGLQALGFERGTRAAILSENRPEWVTSGFRCAGRRVWSRFPSTRLSSANRSPTSFGTPRAKVIFVSTMDHLETVLSIRERVPSLEKDRRLLPFRARGK